MTPLGRILKRIVGQDNDRNETDHLASGSRSVSDDRDSGRDTVGDQVEGEQKRRRRGRRGGRGRRKGGSAVESATNVSESAAAAQSAMGHGESTDDRSRDADGRSGGGQRRGRGPVRGLGDRRGPRERYVEPPLPEDVAFRPAAEGGDDSLLPGRRRRPSGPRTTNRVILVGGRRYLPSVDASREEPPLPPEMPPITEHAEPQATPPARHDERGSVIEEGGVQRKRRRGRRGGRRHEDVATDAESQALDAEESAETGESEQPHRVESGKAQRGVETRSRESEPAVRVDRRHAVKPERAAPVSRQQESRKNRPAAELPVAFAALGVGNSCLQTIAEMGFEEPTPIQERTIPALLDGRDVVGVAQTGSGKTLAFGLPLAESVDVARREVQAVVLVPTRELAQQVLGVLQEIAVPHRLNVVGLLGGRALAGDFRALEGRPHVVVGTPGRILDHLRRGTLELRGVRYAVLDEADEMLDIGFLPDITRILSRTPRRRQTALFSATMPHAVMRLVRRYMQDPETVSVAAQHDTVETIDQYYVEVAHRDKLRGLRELVERELKGRTLVFSRTRRGVDYVSDRLREMGVRAGALHGDMDQRRRDQVVHRFRAGELDLLVATNVAARGLDIPEITHVVNFDVPQNAEEYVHRIGRTGRAGRHGTAITFVSEHDIGEFDVLLAAFGDRLRQERLELYEPV